MRLRAVVGFGANLGSRLETLRSAARALASVTRVERTSHIYVTAPVGPPQPDFLNAAALVTSERTPLDLLGTLLAIEADLGRVRTTRWGPRIIDLDLLWCDGAMERSARLTVPHARLRERAFAVVPLMEVCPDACDPFTGAPYRVPPGQIVMTADVL
ncbi:MAG: 2-amino-4-hydroxy-6-hydroxymethyldihydropteridine diphosphokinase [Polyangiaceae bacterium]